ncbi:MAG TPA: PVC-type heme-binding CxxCH protein [Prosthecobacter sp.]|nr:PVC-type heme-binding CxxCH protein [Prosthecobacter sp.]
MPSGLDSGGGWGVGCAMFSATRLLGFLIIGCQLASAAEVTLHRWSGDLNVPDPVAVSVDPQGRVYVAATTRRKAADLDIREHPMWIPDDAGLTSVEEKREFLKRELAPGKLRLPRGGLKDHNKDGSIDWKDLTVHSERIYQLRDTNGDGTADKMTVFAEGFNTEVTGIAAGILYHDGWVYATIAPDLWRLKDTDDDGVADVRKVVAHGFGMHIAYAGHDMHGPRLGPDGRIYWSIGDKGVNATSREGERWYYPHEGAVMRVEPDGTGFEVFAHGLRNVQEVAFDDFGNMFGVDNDADLPGEKERFVYITERSDSGWRCGHQYMKSESRWIREAMWQPQRPWSPEAPVHQPLFITPPLANYSNGPAGFAREPGTALGASLRGQFILDQFPSGKMDAFAIEPDGAAFKMTKLRTINSGIMGIGLAWGPDGGLYMADWIGGYPLDEKGAIWRVDDPTGAGSTERKETQRLLSEGFAKRPVAELKTLLGHADQRVRVEAQLEIVKRALWPDLLAVARDAKAPLLARVHAVWGCGIGLRKGKMEDADLAAMLPTADPELQAQLAKVLGDAKAGASSRTALVDLLASPSTRVRFHAAIALGKLAVPEAVEALLKMADQEAADPWQRHAVVTGLTGCAKPEQLSPGALKSDNARLAAVLALARQRSPLIQAYLSGASTHFVSEAVRAIHDDEGIPEALEAVAKLPPASLPEATVRRILNANLRLGGREHAQGLLAFALGSSAQAMDAFQALLVFAEPSPLDRVDGMARSYPPRDAAEIAQVIQPQVQALLGLKDPALKGAALEVMVKFAPAVEAPVLQQIVADTTAKPQVRVGALRLMAAQHPGAPTFAATLKLAGAKTAPTELRQEALAQVFIHQPTAALAEAARVLEQGQLSEKQQALKLVAARKGADADKLLDSWMQRLAAGKVEPGLKLDVFEAAKTREALADRVTAYQHARTSAPRDDLLEGGDAAAGKDIVNNHLGGNCLACHTVEAKEGSQVGPNLKNVGSQRTRAALLESLVNPVAQIVPGYGLISVTLKDGSNLAGGLLKQDKKSLTLRMADGATKTVLRTDITFQTPPVSVMPPMLGILTPAEVRDVVAYLASLKGKTSAQK